MHTLARCSIGALLLAVLSCTDNSDFETTTEESPSTVSDAGAGNITLVEANPTDAQIAGVITAANLSEVELGLIALTTGQRQEVRDFAKSMVREHGDAQERQGALFRMLGIYPVPSGTSERLRTMSERVASNLLKERAESIDLTYLEVQISTHEQLLSLFDRSLITHADNAALIVELTGSRETVALHLQTAKALGEALGLQANAGTRATGGATTGGATTGTSGATTGTAGGANANGVTTGANTTTTGTSGTNTGGTGTGGNATTGGTTAGTGGTTAGTGGTTGGTFATTGTTTGGATASASGVGPGFGMGGTSFTTTGGTGSASGAGPGFGATGLSTGSVSGVGPGFGSGATPFGTGSTTGSASGAGPGFSSTGF